METIQMLWIGKKLSKIERLSLLSFLKNGHEVHLYCYDPIENIPNGVTILDANDIVDNSKIFKAHGESYGAFSDLFRHALLYKKGGCWADTDVICLKPFTFEDEATLCAEDMARISTAVLRLPKGNIISEKILENFKTPWRFLPKNSEALIEKIKKEHGNGFLKEIYQYTQWGELGGPMALTKIYAELKLDYTLLVPETFYPVHPTEWWSTFFDPHLKSRIKWDDCYGIHLWNNMFSTYSRFDKTAVFPKGTIINMLFEKYGITT
ncbi:glycosyltransferase [Maribacter chungangensis]|uniref:Glycosyltransferase n=1 Tax=Maribacter chungangensis TaxID=1069117 RepID=A0ABW3B3X7_9FLAO